MKRILQPALGQPFLKLTGNQRSKGKQKILYLENQTPAEQTRTEHDLKEGEATGHLLGQ